MPRRESSALRDSESEWAIRTSEHSQNTLIATYEKLATTVSHRSDKPFTELSEAQRSVVRSAVSGLVEAAN